MILLKKYPPEGFKIELAIYGINGNLYTQYVVRPETFGMVSRTKSTKSLIKAIQNKLLKFISLLILMFFLPFVVNFFHLS